MALLNNARTRLQGFCLKSFIVANACFLFANTGGALSPELISHVSFEEGMGANRGVYEAFAHVNKINLVSDGRLAINVSGQDYLSFFKSLYETKIPMILHNSCKRIPNKIHQIWIGSPLPKKYRPLIQTWREKHPDWEYKLWTDADLDQLPMINRSLYNATRNFGEKADIARLEILYAEGGLFVDIDYQCLNSLEMFRVYDFFASLRPVRYQYLVVANGLIASISHHPFIKMCLDELQNFKHEGSVLQRTGPVFFTKMIYHYMSNFSGNNIVLPSLFLLPLGNPGSPDEFSTCDHLDSAKSFAHHYWDANWLK